MARRRPTAKDRERSGARRSAKHGATWTHRVAALLLVSTVPVGCDRDEAPPAATPTEEPAATTEPEPWRFRPTLDRHLPKGAVAEPVLELSEPRQRTVLVLAAVLRPGSDHVEIERWTYEQIPDQEEGLRVLDEGTTVLRLQPGGAIPELAELRRRVAAPGTVLTRPVGLDVPGPAALVERLAAELAIARNPSAEARARVRAAATLVRALDDTVAFRSGRIGALASVLVPAPAKTTVGRASERRATVSFEASGRTIELDLQRKSEGWAIVSARIPTLGAAAEKP